MCSHESVGEFFGTDFHRNRYLNRQPLNLVIVSEFKPKLFGIILECRTQQYVRHLDVRPAETELCCHSVAIILAHSSNTVLRKI